MDAWFWWLSTFLLLIVIEVFTQSIGAVCLAVGCLGGLVCALCGVAVQWQLLAGSLVALASVFVLAPQLRRLHDRIMKTDATPASTGMDALIGRTGRLEHEIMPEGLGRLRIDGDYWQVKAQDPTARIDRGTLVKVLSYDSIILTVTPYIP